MIYTEKAESGIRKSVASTKIIIITKNLSLIQKLGRLFTIAKNHSANIVVTVRTRRKDSDVSIHKWSLPDEAGHEMHEDYIMCCHWSDVIEKTEKQMEALRPLLEFGVL